MLQESFQFLDFHNDNDNNNDIPIEESQIRLDQSCIPHPINQSTFGYQNNSYKPNPPKNEHQQSFIVLSDLDQRASYLNKEEVPPNNTQDFQIENNDEDPQPSSNDYIVLTQLEKEENGFFNNKYISYDISLMFSLNSNHEKVINNLQLTIEDFSSPKYLSNRRYNNFFMLYESLTKAYPQFIYPKLSEKSYFPFRHDSHQFLNRRLKQLQFLLNYLLNHEVISSSNEFVKFLKDPDFDMNIFQNVKERFEYPETDKYYQMNIINKVSSFNFFSSTKPNQTDNQEKIQGMKKFYNNLQNSFESIYQALNTFIYSFTEESENLDSIGMTLQNQFVNDSNNDKQNINCIEQILMLNTKLKENKNEISLRKAIELVDQFDQFFSIIKGICCVFERYEMFLKKIENVKYAYSQASKTKSKSISIDVLHGEVIKSEQEQEHFEKAMIYEIEQICKKYRFILVNTVYQLGDFIVNNTKEELLVFQNP